MCIYLASLNRACSQDLFWPSRVGRSGGYICTYICMPFSLLNACTTYQRFTRLALASHEARSSALAPHEAPTLHEPPEP